ncbi:hypothetical protein TraAM80_03119 [Trypanosoma rangeli]|uniref:EF-hand domain-containing protein n=1 Tax=Trypanosoma rangeli TaxID=5698 RepID=A0A422NQZ4_TRYRA|nr:uncharacterized protein TraAM80_03119 [Trypanosoma rangeli]RNF07861.1 hypothetical protein TraAM80_03119 [Trypanosoma rangeli]|eukprot:RNF07861.1 hypothetical protein TraAM80_03119 [Trypanosoma rangeli]
MSDSESIVFCEHTENDSLHGGGPRGPQSNSHQKREIPLMLDKPPLPRTKRREIVKQASPPLKAAHPKSSSAAAEGSHDDWASEHSESICFHIDGAETNASTATGGVATAVNTPQFPPTHDAGGYEAHRTDRGRSGSQRTDCDDESIHFYMEGSIRSRPGVMPHTEIVPNDSIIFQVVDDSKTDDTAPGETSTPPLDKDTASPVVPTLHATKEAEGDVLAKKIRSSRAVQARRGEDAPIKENTAKGTAHANQPQRAHPASTRGKRIPSLPLAENTTNNKSTGSIPSSPSSVAAHEEALNHGSALPTILTSEISGAHLGATRTRQGAAPVHSKEDSRVAKSAATGVGKASLPKRRSRSSNLVEQVKVKQAPTAVDKTSSDRSPPLVFTEVPVSCPRTQLDATRVSTLYLLEERILQAKLYTEHWRLFNDVQREEIARLIKLIAKARQPENLLCPLDTGAKEKQPTTVALGGFADLLRQRRTAMRNPADAATRSTSHVPQPRRSLLPGSSKRALSVPPNGTVPRGPGLSRRRCDRGVSDARLLKAAKARRSAPALQEPQPAPVQATRGGWFPQLHNAAARDGASKLAQTLGIIWPPCSPDALFFMTGTRLTPQQRDEFYEAVKLQCAASEGLYAELQRSVTAQPRELRASHRKKLMLSRTSILRKAFTLMDVDKSGLIRTTDIPAMQCLLEAERKQLEAKADGGAKTATVFARAKAEQRQLKGMIDAKRAAKNSNGASLSAATEVALYGLVIDVIFPLIRASNLVVCDFASLGLLVFGSLYLSEKGASASFVEWREAARRCFEALA